MKITDTVGADNSIGSAHRATWRLPRRIYLWLAVAIFGSAGALTRKITDIGAQHPIDGHNPISLCNILFVGNLCALVVLVAIHHSELNRSSLARISLPLNISAGVLFWRVCI